jgi:hypothetical protein
MTSRDARRFEATWRLVPERSVYQHGAPPRDGTYRIAAVPGGLSFTLDWHDADGAAHHAEFSLTWDGEVPASLELVDEATLNTTVEKGDVVVAHASRRLSPDGNELEIVQSGVDAQGRRFENRAWYVRG